LELTHSILAPPLTMQSSILSRIPILRVLVPFMLGILLHRCWHCLWVPIALIGLSIIGYLLLSYGSRSPSGRLRWRSYFIIPLAIVSLSLGWLAAIINCPPHLADDQRANRVLTGRVTDLHYTDFSMRMTIQLLNNDLPRCKVLISTRGCDYTMRTGDLVQWEASLTEIKPQGNPEEMDYAAYLLDGQGIRYQQHLPVREIVKVGYSPTLLTRMATTRQDISRKVFNSRLSTQAQHFVTALLLGNSSYIDKATRQEFSLAGVAHVLALSGLHVGFIALLIWWLLFPLDYLRLRKLRLVITLAAISLFAVFTGQSPSVVRATIMIGCVFASVIFYRRSVSLNALALAALIILVFSPSSLYSVGFQLSFITVASILLFADLPMAITSSHRWVNRLSSTVIASLVAMLATVALTAHYFHTVSLLSVLSNLLILPVLPVFMILGALFLLVTAAGLHWPFLDWAIDTIYRFIHWATMIVNGIPGSHVGNVYVNTTGVVLYFIIVALAVSWLYSRRYRYLLTAGFALVVLLAHSLWIDYNTPRRGLVIFNAFASTPLIYYQDGTGYIWALDDEDNDTAAYSRYYSGFIARHNINRLVLVSPDTLIQQDAALFQPPYAHLMGRRILAVGSGKQKSATADKPMQLDDIIVTKRFHGSAADLRKLYGFQRLVISGAMYDATTLIRECDSLAIPYINLADGALVITNDSIIPNPR